jgi:hypothetical protein
MAVEEGINRDASLTAQASREEVFCEGQAADERENPKSHQTPP